MKKSRFLAAVLLVTPVFSLFGGCGGGGGGSSTNPTPIPTLAPTPTVGARVLLVQLRDRAGNPVEGVVSIGISPVAGTSILATTGGNVTFNRNLAAGEVPVSAEVDGALTKATVTVKSGGTTALTITITPIITPAPTATLPPPPF